MITVDRGFYIAGGTMPPDAPSYVERQADRDLFDGLRRGEFCYVLTARQMGKSSLMVRTAARLRQSGVAVAILDLTVIGQNLTAEQWYSGLLAMLGEQLDQEPELWDYWQTHGHLSPVQRWMGAIRDVLLARAGVRCSVSGVREDRSPPKTEDRTPNTDLVIFLDEIDAVRSLPFSTDEFFAALRACYNRRSDEPEFHRLTFCLLGVATPSDLIQDTRTTPFNIGRRIELTDLTEAEAVPLALGLGGPAQPGSAGVPPASDHAGGTPALPGLLQRILYWTGGHPYLTQRLCQAVAESVASGQWSVASQGGGAQSSSLLTTDLVDRHCEALFLSSSARERDDNLLFVRERLLRSEVDRASLLDLYGQVWQRKRVPDEDDNPLVNLLRLAGVVRIEQARSITSSGHHPIRSSAVLRVRNRIYERVFDREWVLLHMPDAELRRQRRAYRTGLARAASAAGVVLVVVTGLAFAAIEQARLADRHASISETATQHANAQLLRALRERDRANREAARARKAERLERVQRQQTEEQRQRAEDQRQHAEASHQEAIRQQQIAAAREADAERARRRAERAEDDATKKLWSSYLAHARAVRWSARPGRRFDSLEALAQAAAINPTAELRDEAVAALALIDLRRIRERQFPRESTAVALDPGLERYALDDRQGGVRLYRLSDNREVQRLRGVGPVVGPLRFSPDGRFLAAGSRSTPSADGELVVWDLRDSRTVLRATKCLLGGALDFSSDSLRIAAAREDGTIRVYDLGSGEELNQLPSGPRPHSLSFHPDGHRLAVTSLERPAIRICDIATGRAQTTITPPAVIREVAWHPDKTLLAAAGDDWRVYVWNPAAPGSPLAVLEGHHGEVTRVGFRHGGNLLVSTGWDETVRVWDLATQSQVVSCPGGSVSFGRDEGRLGLVSKSSQVQVWELTGGRECQTIRYSGAGKGPWSASISADGRLLASSGDTGVRLWDLAQGKVIASLLHGKHLAAFFDPASHDLITSGVAGLHRWPARAVAAAIGSVRFDPPLIPGHGELVGRAAMSRDGRTLAVVRGHFVHVLDLGQPGEAPPPGSAAGLRSQPGEWLSRFHGQQATELMLDISPDGRWVATGTWQGTGVRVWSARTGRLVKELPVRDSAHTAFSPDGQWLATATGAETRLWRVGSWKPGLVLRQKEPEGVPSTLAFSPDGRILAAPHSRSEAQLVEVSTGRQLALLQAPNAHRAYPLCFSPDGRLLVTKGGPELIHVWDLPLIRKQLAVMGLDWAPKEE